LKGKGPSMWLLYRDRREQEIEMEDYRGG
jgi:hypothetical protein